ncbi:MAG: EAL domain-containing protein [Acidimicrobiales bacterium]
MPEPRPHSLQRRHTMRSLRSGTDLAQPVAPTNDPDEVRPGLIESEAAFLAGLDRTIDQADADSAIFVFRLQGVAKSLHRWSAGPSPAGRQAESAVEAALLNTRPDLALYRHPDRDLIGFSIEPQNGGAAERLGRALMAGLSDPLGGPGRQFVFSPRLGVCAFDRSDGRSREAIEAATSTVEQTSFGTPFLIHNDYIADRRRRLSRTADELPAAVAGGRITVDYQPRVTTVDRDVVGIEAFSRWYHGDRGSIPPVEFLPVAERHGLLVELGSTVRDEAVTTARCWQQDGLLDDRRLWMNVAPLELCHPDFDSSVVELVGQTPYLALGFEVADSRLLEDMVFLRIFDRLQELGVRLALDNVDQNTISFGRIRRLPLSMINLDGELVRSLPSSAANRELVRLICASAADRNMSVTACGAETEEQIEVAELCGVDLVQGFAISKALRPDSMVDQLRNGNPFGRSAD